MKEKILKEIDYNLEMQNKLLDMTYNENTKEYTNKDTHLIALGQVIALQDIKYSIVNDNWEYERNMK